MLFKILKSKIHKAVVTDAQIHYSGSITIDSQLMKEAGLIPYEKVMVVSLDSGERLETYAIEGKHGSGEVIINGAAARKIIKGDTVIIMSFAQVDSDEAKNFKPSIIILDKFNKIISHSAKVDKKNEC